MNVRQVYYLVLVLLTASVSFAGYNVIGLTPATDNSYLALQVTMDQDQVLEGISWFNSDSASYFIDVRLAAITDTGVPDIVNSMIVASDVAGQEMSWSELVFPDPVISEAGDLFILFHYPQGIEGGTPGQGPGIGFRSRVNEHSAFASSDGETWNNIHESVDLMISPIYSENKAGGTAIVFTQPVVPVIVTSLSRPYPNPFNPATTIDFSLNQEGPVVLSVYNARGEQVIVLVDEVLKSGYQSVVWRGQDSKGRAVASGVYLVQMKADRQVFTKQMVLAR